MWLPLWLQMRQMWQRDSRSEWLGSSGEADSPARPVSSELDYSASVAHQREADAAAEICVLLLAVRLTTKAALPDFWLVNLVSLSCCCIHCFNACHGVAGIPQPCRLERG